jgi:peptide deformylase
MKQRITVVLTILLAFTTSISAQVFSPASYIEQLSSPSRVFKSHLPADSIVLTTPSANVSPFDPSIKILISQMYRTVIDSLSRGVGIAAPQIGVNKRVILVQRLDKTEQPFEAYINPIILQYSKLKALRAEGCLSIDDFRCEVERPYAILVAYFTIAGEYKMEMVEDFVARIFQHEIDHLDGVLFPERVAGVAEK